MTQDNEPSEPTWGIREGFTEESAFEKRCRQSGEVRVGHCKQGLQFMERRGVSTQQGVFGASEPASERGWTIKWEGQGMGEVAEKSKQGPTVWAWRAHLRSGGPGWAKEALRLFKARSQGNVSAAE